MPSQATSPVRANIAATIDREMCARELTNRAVAERIGSTEHQVWRWRRGHVKPSDANLAALAGILTGGEIASFFMPAPVQRRRAA